MNAATGGARPSRAARGSGAHARNGAGGRLRRFVEDRAGGPARSRVVVVFAAVLALNTADLATVGAVAAELKRDLLISNAQIGLLAGASSLSAALATLPIGVLTDRVCRTRLLAIGIAVWSLAMGASAFATSFEMLLMTRLLLGTVAATAGPTLASLTGDLFPSAERGRIYGLMLSGELIGVGAGLLVGGAVAGLLSWRASFLLLALPGLALAWVVLRRIPEPERGGASRLEPGAAELRPAATGAGVEPGGTGAPDAADGGEGIAEEEVRSQHVEPYADRVLDRDPAAMSTLSAVRHVLRVRTNVVLIAASAIGYFFFSGMQTFAVVFARGQYGLSQVGATALLAVTGLGALGGVLIAGRLADRMLAGGRLDARILVGAVAYVAAAVVILPALLLTSALLAAPLLLLGAAALGAPNPPVDAARLDVMPAGLWGRAEGVRTVAQGASPLVFGVLADALGSSGLQTSGQGSAARATDPTGLQGAFLIMLVPLALNGLIMLRARRTYPRDVATAMAA